MGRVCECGREEHRGSRLKISEQEFRISLPRNDCSRNDSSGSPTEWAKEMSRRRTDTQLPSHNFARPQPNLQSHALSHTPLLSAPWSPRISNESITPLFGKMMRPFFFFFLVQWGICQRRRPLASLTILGFVNTDTLRDRRFSFYSLLTGKIIENSSLFQQPTD
jgi:hypothetical protein